MFAHIHTIHSLVAIGIDRRRIQTKQNRHNLLRILLVQPLVKYTLFAASTQPLHQNQTLHLRRERILSHGLVVNFHNIQTPAISANNSPCTSTAPETHPPMLCHMCRIHSADLWLQTLIEILLPTRSAPTSHHPLPPPGLPAT